MSKPNKPKYVLPKLTPAVMRMSRAALGWTQADLAKQCRVTPSTITGLEMGDRKPVITKYWAIRGAFENNHLSYVIEDGLIVGVRWPKGYF